MKILENIKIIDLSTVLAGPSVGTFFAELGADVIKLEHPKFGDVTRTWKLPKEDSNSNISAYFSSINYKKKYGKIDLKSDSDRDKLLSLIKESDIILSNFKNGDAEKFGISDELLLKLNPKIIIGKINGYGEDSDRVAYDLILQAETGFMSMNGTPESGPVKMPVALVDVLAAHHLKEGILLALYEREKMGIGKVVSVSLYEAAVSSLVNQASNYLMSGHIPQRIGSTHPNIAPYGELFETKDGATITFAIGSDTHFKKLCETLNLAQLVNDSKFKSNQVRVINRVELAKSLTQKIKNLISTDLLLELELLNVPAGKVKNLAEVFETKEAKSMIREEEIDGVLTKRVTSIAFR